MTTRDFIPIPLDFSLCYVLQTAKGKESKHLPGKAGIFGRVDIKEVLCAARNGVSLLYPFL